MSGKSIFLIGVIIGLFSQCTKESLLNEREDLSMNKQLQLKVGETETSNNLSFPVITTDGFSLSAVSESWGEIYTGPFTGLTEAEVDSISANGPWYAQKELTNKWQADYLSSENEIQIKFIDWGDLIESVNPVVNHPFRIELTLYTNVWQMNPQMQLYTMAVLANPSSADELQGTNKEKNPSHWASVASPYSAISIQKLATEDLHAKWDKVNEVWISQSGMKSSREYGFGLELNVGGKYIYGTTSGGWRPASPGIYRITFYLSAESNINLKTAQIGNYLDNSEVIGSIESKAAEPKVDTVNNVTYVDVEVVSGSGGGKGGKGGNGGNGGKN